MKFFINFRITSNSENAFGIVIGIALNLYILSSFVKYVLMAILLFLGCLCGHPLFFSFSLDLFPCGLLFFCVSSGFLSLCITFVDF